MSYLSDIAALQFAAAPVVQSFGASQAGLAASSGLSGFAQVLAAEMATSTMTRAVYADEEETESASSLPSFPELALSALAQRSSAPAAPLSMSSQAEPAVSDVPAASEGILASGAIEAETVAGAHGLEVSAAYAKPTIEELQARQGLETLQITSVSSPAVYGVHGEDAAANALLRLGDPYSQVRRGTGSYVDCSYLTQWSYRNAGVNLPGTAAEQARYIVDHGLEVDRGNLQRGDLVFWNRADCGCGRYDEIHHVGIYLGDGKVIEASSSAGQVVVNDLWGEDGNGRWKICLFGRPA